ncbi:biotin-independent malonate decarboxylase subunit gamma [Vibrio sp. PP-XX7]
MQARETAIVAIIDVPSQAYGRREEAYAIHQALAASVNAYAQARMAGHPIVGLIVGKAMSGGFLAHGYQANRLIALDDEGCMVHAMGKASAARITLRSVAELEALAATIPPMAYDIQNYSALGLLWDKVTVNNATDPTSEDLQTIHQIMVDAIEDILRDKTRDLSGRLKGKIARLHSRSASRWQKAGRCKRRALSVLDLWSVLWSVLDSWPVLIIINSQHNALDFFYLL